MWEIVSSAILQNIFFNGWRGICDRQGKIIPAITREIRCAVSVTVRLSVWWIIRLSGGRWTDIKLCWLPYQRHDQTPVQPRRRIRSLALTLVPGFTNEGSRLLPHLPSGSGVQKQKEPRCGDSAKGRWPWPSTGSLYGDGHPIENKLYWKIGSCGVVGKSNEGHCFLTIVDFYASIKHDQ